MRTKLTFAFTAAALAGGLLSSCYVAQPSFECFPSASHYTGDMKLLSPEVAGDCDTYTIDSFQIQRYLPPGTTQGSIAVMSERMGKVTRLRHGDSPSFVYPVSGKESAIGPLASINPGADGLCKSNLAAADESFAATTQRTKDFPKDGGVKQLAAKAIKYEYKDFRFLNTARFPGTIFKTQLDVTVDGCKASYEVNGVVDSVLGPVACETDADCDTNPNLDAGRALGSGLPAEIKPKCGRDQVCVGSVPFEDLVKLD